MLPKSSHFRHATLLSGLCVQATGEFVTFSAAEQLSALEVLPIPRSPYFKSRIRLFGLVISGLQLSHVVSSAAFHNPTHTPGKSMTRWFPNQSSSEAKFQAGQYCPQIMEFILSSMITELFAFQAETTSPQVFHLGSLPKTSLNIG